MNQLGKADSQPNILTFSDCQGNPVGNLQALIKSKAPTKIPGVQLTPAPTITEATEQAISEEPTIQVDFMEHPKEPVPALKEEDFTPPAEPDDMQAEDSIQPNIKTTLTEAKPDDPEPELAAESHFSNDLESDEEILQLHCSS